MRESRLLAPSGHGREFTQPSLRLFLHICSSVLRCSLPFSPSPLISDERETVYLPYPNSLSSSTRFALLLNNNLIPQLQSDKCKCKFSSFMELQHNFECENRHKSLLRFHETPQNALLSSRFNLKRFSCGQMASRSLNRISSFVPRVRKRYFRRSRNRVRDKAAVAAWQPHECHFLSVGGELHVELILYAAKCPLVQPALSHLA